MKNAKFKNRNQASKKTNKGNNEPNQNPRHAENLEMPEKVSASSYMITATLILPIACFVIYYVINKPSIEISDNLRPLSPEVSGWQRASTEEEMKYNTSLCTIERREAESLDSEEFEKVYR